MTDRYAHDSHDAPPSEVLDRAAADHGERYGSEDPNFLDWLAEQQLAKQSLGELAFRQDLRDALDTVDLDFTKVPPRDERPKARKPVDTTKAIRGADLLKLDLPPLKWVVPDLIPEGTAILATPPKIGKSSLIYQTVVEIACGGSLLGRKVARGSALYLALEDGPRRGQAKLRQALGGRVLPEHEDGRRSLDVWWNAPMIGEGLEEKLHEWIASKPDPVLIAIDTLERIRPESDSRKASAYRIDVRHLSLLQGAFRDTDVALVIVHHSRKDTSDDFVQAVSGTYGLTGSADTILTIARTRSESYAMIKATGREVGEIELPARFVDGLWTVDPGALAAVSPERLEVYDIIRKRGPIMPLGIARMLRRTSDSDRVSIQQMMSKMLGEGIIQRVKGGYTVVPLLTADSGAEH